MAEKTLTARIPEDLHKQLRIKLTKDNMTYQDWVSKMIKDYVNGSLKVSLKE
ncbi:MAG: hypothetical protein ACOCP4_06610 [Candidatus Woesearchaeota archaeon]